MRRYTVNPGDLRTLVTIIRTVKEPDEDNILIAKDMPLYTTKGKVETIKPKKFGDNNTYFHEQERKILIRYNPKFTVKEDDRVKIKDEVYDIVFIDNKLEQDRYLEIQIRKCADKVMIK